MNERLVIREDSGLAAEFDTNLFGQMIDRLIEKNW
jgi:hypothetical protein